LRTTQVLLAFLLGAPLFWVTACGDSSHTPPNLSANGTSERTLYRGNGPDPDTLDPQKAQSVEAQNILRDLYECLTSLDHDGRPAPGAAASWKVSDDGAVFTFSLRKDARWSNGDAVTADDFVAGLRRLVDPTTASGYGATVSIIRNARDILSGRRPPADLGVSAPDAATVVIALEHPAPYLPALLSDPSTAPIHRPTFLRYGERFSRPGVMESNGAFVLQAWVPGHQVIARRNPFYWGNATTYFDTVQYEQIASDSAEFMRYRAGGLDITASVPRSEVPRIREQWPSELHIAPQLGIYYYGFNLDRPPFRDNLKLRQALSLAIDRQQLVDAVLQIGERPAYGWVPEDADNYESQSMSARNLTREERRREALRLYHEAGHSPGHPLHFELRYNQGEIHTRVAVVVAEMWREMLGVDVQLVAVEFAALLGMIESHQVDMFRSSWIGDYNDAITFAQVFRSDSGINMPNYRSAEYDRLLDLVAADADSGSRRAHLQDAERVLLKDSPIIPIYFYVSKHMVKPRIHGWYQNIMNVVYSKDLTLSESSPQDP